MQGFADDYFERLTDTLQDLEDPEDLTGEGFLKMQVRVLIFTREMRDRMAQDLINAEKVAKLKREGDL